MAHDMITEQYIHDQIYALTLECNMCLPVKEWFMYVEESTVNNKNPLWLGYSDSNGMLSISGIFVGTEHYSLLEQVIRHELAHFAVGVHEGHNKLWKRHAELFGVHSDATFTAPVDFLVEMFKYVVMVHTASGEHFYGLQRRKIKRDLNKRGYEYCGEQVLRLECIEINTDRGRILVDKYADTL